LVEEGQEAPDFTLPDQSGEPLRLAALRGQTVVLYFYPRADTQGRLDSNGLVQNRRLRQLRQRHSCSRDVGPDRPGVTSAASWIRPDGSRYLARVERDPLAEQKP
jgi:hypothetical protein